jgi:hypothetical protein
VAKTVVVCGLATPEVSTTNASERAIGEVGLCEDGGCRSESEEDRGECELHDLMDKL